MTVGSSVGVSSALGALTNSGTQQLQQRIAAKVVMDQMESEAAMAMKIVESSNPPSVGSRVDFRA